jgi:hypothetical protein
MDHAECQDERETLEGIVSILLSLAVFAEFLCLLPLAIRLPVLMLLRPAEAVARAFAFECAGGGLALPPAASPGPDRDGRSEAMRLARCFRVLAAVISGLQGFVEGRSRGDWRARSAAPVILGFVPRICSANRIGRTHSYYPRC